MGGKKEEKRVVYIPLTAQKEQMRDEDARRNNGEARAQGGVKERRGRREEQDGTILPTIHSSLSHASTDPAPGHQFALPNGQTAAGGAQDSVLNAATLLEESVVLCANVNVEGSTPVCVDDNLAHSCFFGTFTWFVPSDCPASRRGHH